MADIVVPTLGESVTEATVLKWFKKAGDEVAVDEPLLELETDKVTIEVPAPQAGVLSEIAAEDGSEVEVGALLGRIEAGAAGTKSQAKPKPAEKPAASGGNGAAKSAPEGGAKADGDTADNDTAGGDTTGGDTVEVAVPQMGESVAEGTIAQWLKKVGDSVEVDEALCELETDKATVELPSPAAGTLQEIRVEAGTDVEVGTVVAIIATGAGAAAARSQAPAKSETPAQPEPAAERGGDGDDEGEEPALSPAVRKLVDENSLDPRKIPATGPKGRITKEDVLNFIGGCSPAAQPTVREKEAPTEPLPSAKPAQKPQQQAPAAPRAAITPASELPERPEDPRGEERVRMSRLRQRIAQRLKEAQDTAAMLTTYNEVDMTDLMALRSEYRDAFEKKHGVRLGFLSFFIKASIQALKEYPAVNAEIYGDQLIYKNYYDVGVAVGTPQGLVVPVLRDADKMSFGELEGTVAEFGKRARDGKLTLADMSGGTFTISNGGVYGSLMSMPILNPPQSGILGMHKIQKRPMVVGDEIKIRNMMYLALSYDHRIIDGREAVLFLVRVKECIEDPQRLLLDV